jgi:hypothetical protein
MMRIVDGVASPEDEQAFAAASSEYPEWETELRAYRSIKEVTDQMQYKEMPDSYWKGYWENLYRKLERGIGWILMSIGAIILIAFVFTVGFWEFFTDPQVPIILKGGIFIGGLGVIVMLVSVLRERLFARNHDRYEREVER